MGQLMFKMKVTILKQKNPKPYKIYPLKHNIESVNLLEPGYLSSSSAIGFAWSDTNMSWVLFKDLNTRVWTECFCTSYDNSNKAFIMCLLAISRTFKLKSKLTLG